MRITRSVFMKPALFLLQRWSSDLLIVPRFVPRIVDGAIKRTATTKTHPHPRVHHERTHRRSFEWFTIFGSRYPYYSRSEFTATALRTNDFAGKNFFDARPRFILQLNLIVLFNLILLHLLRLLHCYALHGVCDQTNTLCKIRNSFSRHFRLPPRWL